MTYAQMCKINAIVEVSNPTQGMKYLIFSFSRSVVEAQRSVPPLKASRKNLILFSENFRMVGISILNK